MIHYLLARAEGGSEWRGVSASVSINHVFTELLRRPRHTRLSDAALNALEDIDQPRAHAIATAIRNVDFPLGRTPVRSIEPQE